MWIVNSEFCSQVDFEKLTSKANWQLTIHKVKQSRNSIGQSIGFLNRKLQVRILSRLQKRSIEVMVTCATVSWALLVLFPHRPHRFTDIWLRLSPGKKLKWIWNWKDNGGCLPALDAGGHRFESYFPDEFCLWQRREVNSEESIVNFASQVNWKNWRWNGLTIHLKKRFRSSIG